jgi:hypothetical protein
MRVDSSQEKELINTTATSHVQEVGGGDADNVDALKSLLLNLSGEVWIKFLQVDIYFADSTTNLPQIKSISGIIKQAKSLARPYDGGYRRRADFELWLSYTTSP